MYADNKVKKDSVSKIKNIETIMIRDAIISNIEKLPEKYLREVLDFSEFLLGKARHQEEDTGSSRGGFGATKGDYIISDDFDEPLEDFKEYMQ